MQAASLHVVRDQPQRVRVEGAGSYHKMGSVQEAGVAATTYQIEYDEEATFLARRRIVEHAMSAVQPFCHGRQPNPPP